MKKISIGIVSKLCKEGRKIRKVAVLEK